MMRFPREVRDSDPLESLTSTPTTDDRVVQVVSTTLMAALPDTTIPGTLFDLGLASLFVQQIWENAGEDGDANAAASLHNSLTRAPQCPGLSHFARSVLSLALCARWGGKLGLADQQLRRSLRALVDATDPDAVFWAEYIGTVAAAMATVVPAWPRAPERVTNAIKFSSAMEDSGTKTKITLSVTVQTEASKGIDLQDMEDLIKKVGKTASSDIKKRKVKVQIHQVSKL